MNGKWVFSLTSARLLHLKNPAFRCLPTITEPSTSPLPCVTASWSAHQWTGRGTKREAFASPRLTRTEELQVRQRVEDKTGGVPPCSKLSEQPKQWSLSRRCSKAGEPSSNPSWAATVLWAMPLPFLSDRSCSADSSIRPQLRATRLLKWRTVTHILMWQIYSVTLGSALHRRYDTHHSRLAPKKQLH